MKKKIILFIFLLTLLGCGEKKNSKMESIQKNNDNYVEGAFKDNSEDK